MADFLRQLLGIGLSEIFQVNEVSQEKSSGSEPEVVSTTFVAKKGDGYVSVTTEFRTNKYQRFRKNISQTEFITAAQYEELSAGQSRLDSPQAIAKLKAEYEHQLKTEKLTPKCPQCKVPMWQRLGPERVFWGCKNFPRL